MNRLFSLCFLTLPLACLCSTTPVTVPINAAPPSFPSSSYAFAQIAQPTTPINASVDPSQLPCFQAYDFLCNALTITDAVLDINGNQPSLISQVQAAMVTPAQANTSFLELETSIIQQTNQRLSES